MSLAFVLFFFDTKTIQQLFFKKKELYTDGEIIIPKFSNPLVYIFSFYIIIQLILPLRHHLIKDNVLWTEEGHRMSWRMMLRSKQGVATYRVVNKTTNKTTIVKLDNYLTRKQQHNARTKPDVIWQFAQHLKNEYKDKGEDVFVYVDCKIRVNGKPFKTLINPDVDLASEKWNVFNHSTWLLPSN